MLKKLRRLYAIVLILPLLFMPMPKPGGNAVNAPALAAESEALGATVHWSATADTAQQEDPVCILFATGILLLTAAAMTVGIRLYREQEEEAAPHGVRQGVSA